MVRFSLSSAGWLCSIGLLTTAIPVLAIPEGTIGPIVAAEPPIAQAEPSDQFKKLIDEGMRLWREGSKESLTAAIKQYEQALQLSRTENKRVQALASLVLGRTYTDLGENPKALQFYNQALLLFRGVKDRDGEATVLNSIGVLYADLGEKLKALEFYNQALPLHRAEGNRGGEAKTLNNIGAFYADLGENTKAIEFYNQALPLYRAVGDRGGEATTFSNIGLVYNTLGDKPKALGFYNQALPLHRAVGDRRSEAITIANIGGVYDDLGQKSKALQFYNLALSLHRAVGDRGSEAATLNNVGRVYDDLGQKPKALEFYNQALPLRRAVGDHGGEAITLITIGSVYSNLGDKQKALVFYNQALPIFRTVGNQRGEASTLIGIGSVYADLGEKPKALEFYNQALPIFRTAGDRGGEASTLNNIGSVYSDLGDKQKALEFYNQALPISRAVGGRSGEATTLNNIGFLLESQKQPQLAIVFLKQSVSVYESLRQDIRRLPKKNQESYTKSVESTYRGLADLLLKQDRILEAQQVLDLLKVQELNDYLKNVRGKSASLENLPPETAILKKYGELETSAIQLGDELAKLRAIPDTTRTPAQNQRIEKLVKLQEDLNKQFNEFSQRPDIVALTKALTPELIRQTVDTKQLDALRGELTKLNAVIITPLITENSLELIITTPNSPPLRRTVPVKREELNIAIKDYRAVLQDTTRDPKPIAQKLYNWLIKPLETELAQAKPQTLIYAPDAQLRYIPLAALHDGTQWLTQRYAINHITAQSLTNFTAQPNHIPKILAGAIGDNKSTITIAGSKPIDFKGLPFTTREVESIQSLQPTARIVKDDGFTLANIKPKFGDYNILHLATHATLIPSNAENSFIVFGNQTYATLHDIESWSLNNFDLVVLSACETGLGSKSYTTNGAEILGLGYQFQTRGAKATIASLWKVDDGGTQILMTAFYAALKQGNSKTHALQLAQTALITNNFKLVGLPQSRWQLTNKSSTPIASSQPEWKGNGAQPLAHPHYWAPFILIGNGL